MKKLWTMLLALALLLSMTAVNTVAGAEQELTPLEVFIVSPWVTNELPPDDINIYKQFFAQQYGVELNLSYSSDGETELLTRFTSGNAPDVVHFANFNQLNKFYEQEILLDDWTPFKEQFGEFIEAMTEEQVAFFTRNGKLMALATAPGEQSYSWMIREDWLNKLGLSMPTTLDELYDVLYAFTYNDPDGDGKNNTYGITSAGGGTSVGELCNLQLFFGPINWYLDENGKVSHPVLSGEYKEYLDFVKKLYDNGILDPNWYTQGWEDRKSELFAGSYGMCYYPPAALLNESLSARRDNAADDWWTLLPFPSGKLDAKALTGTAIISVSEECAQDEAKMAALARIMNNIIPSKDDYYKVNYFVEIDGAAMIRNDDGTVYYWYTDPNYVRQRGSGEGQYIATALYSQFLRATGADNTFSGNYDATPSEHVKKVMSLTATVNNAERYSPEAKYLTLDSSTMEEADMVYQEFTINYIMGVDDDYDSFVEAWLAAGAEALKAQAEEQWIEWGFIK